MVDFKDQKSMWTIFTWNKYYKRHAPQVVEWKGGSQTWKYMIEARNYVDQEIWWEPKSGNANIWYDNWRQLGALHYYLPVSNRGDHQFEDVNQLVYNGRWNPNLLDMLFPEEVCNHIQHNLMVEDGSTEWDKPWWMLHPSGNFTVKSAWEI